MKCLLCDNKNMIEVKTNSRKYSLPLTINKNKKTKLYNKFIKSWDENKIQITLYCKQCNTYLPSELELKKLL